MEELAKTWQVWDVRLRKNLNYNFAVESKSCGARPNLWFGNSTYVKMSQIFDLADIDDLIWQTTPARKRPKNGTAVIGWRWPCVQITQQFVDVS